MSRHGFQGGPEPGTPILMALVLFALIFSLIFAVS